MRFTNINRIIIFYSIQIFRSSCCYMWTCLFHLWIFLRWWICHMLQKWIVRGKKRRWRIQERFAKWKNWENWKIRKQKWNSWTFSWYAYSEMFSNINTFCQNWENKTHVKWVINKKRKYYLWINSTNNNFLHQNMKLSLYM